MLSDKHLYGAAYTQIGAVINSEGKYIATTKEKQLEKISYAAVGSSPCWQ